MDQSHPPGAPKVDRGHRIADEAHMTEARDGKEIARFVRPYDGHLPADTQGCAPGRPATVEDVVASPATSSAWEAIEEDADDPATPGRKGRDPAQTEKKAER